MNVENSTPSLSHNVSACSGCGAAPGAEMRAAHSHSSASGPAAAESALASATHESASRTARRTIGVRRRRRSHRQKRTALQREGSDVGLRRGIRRPLRARCPAGAGRLPATGLWCLRLGRRPAERPLECPNGPPRPRASLEQARAQDPAAPLPPTHELASRPDPPPRRHRR
eukprot:scaffold7957_cov108-Isochrysis_galbana.AAC.2